MQFTCVIGACISTSNDEPALAHANTAGPMSMLPEKIQEQIHDRTADATQDETDERIREKTLLTSLSSRRRPFYVREYL